MDPIRLQSIIFTLLTTLLYSPSPTSAISMDPLRKAEIFKWCYSRSATSYSSYSPIINGQLGYPLASSVENLIGLIEKIESTPLGSRFQAHSLAAGLLKFYRSDKNVVKRYVRLEQDDSYKLMDKIENMLLEDVNYDNPDDLLTENEKCSLHFMLSYNINNTNKYDRKSRPFEGGLRPERPRYPEQAVQAREYGVGSFRFNSHQAIALNRILLGVIAGYSSGRGVRVDTLLNKLNPESPSNFRVKFDELLDPLPALTLGNILAQAANTYETPHENIGVSGEWDHTSCSTEYTLTESYLSDATLSQLRGGVDGYFMGQLIEKLRSTSNGRRLKLSQILRYYYDPVGSEMLAVGYCKRPSAPLDERLIRDSATNYLRVLKASKDPIVDDKEVMDDIAKKESAFNQALGRARSLPSEDGEWCSLNEPGIGREQCESASDVFIAIDMNDAENRFRYKNLTAFIAKSLNLGVNAGSLTILTLNRDDGQSAISWDSGPSKSSSYPSVHTFHNNLRHVAWGSHNKGQPTCALKFLRDEELGSFVAAPSADLYVRINDTLRDFRESKKYLLGVPSKVFILMGGIFSGRNTDENIRYAHRRLKRNHQDVPILLVTDSDPRDMLGFVHSEQDVIRYSESLELLTRSIVSRICEVPATFQYPDCMHRASREDRVEGYITRNRKQYWAFYPQYFLKSFYITMKFKAVTGGLRVCYGRSPKPEETREWCEEAKKGEEITFRQQNPCDGYELVNCPPFYFTLVAFDEGADVNNLCTGPKCLNLKQTKFEFSHTGVQCSFAFFNGPSILMILISIVFTLSRYFG